MRQLQLFKFAVIIFLAAHWVKLFPSDIVVSGQELLDAWFELLQVGCTCYFISRQVGFGPDTWVGLNKLFYELDSKPAFYNHYFSFLLVLRMAQVFEMEILLPNFYRYGSSISLEYLVCIYKVPCSGIWQSKSSPFKSDSFRMWVRWMLCLDIVVLLRQGFNALSSLEYIYEFPGNWGEIIFCIMVMVCWIAYRTLN